MQYLAQPNTEQKKHINFSVYVFGGSWRQGTNKRYTPNCHQFYYVETLSHRLENVPEISLLSKALIWDYFEISNKLIELVQTIPVYFSPVSPLIFDIELDWRESTVGNAMYGYMVLLRVTPKYSLEHSWVCLSPTPCKLA